MNKLQNFRVITGQYPARFWMRAIAFLLPCLILLTGCSLPQVRAEDRLLLDLSVDFLGEYRLPKLTFAETVVGGLSGLTYDRQRDRFYAISDDRGEYAPARFYTLKLDFSSTPEIGIRQVEIEKVTFLTGEAGQPLAPGTFDLEGIALSPRQSIFVSSEGVANRDIAPFIDEFDRETGQWKNRLPIPIRFIPGTMDEQAIGVQDNLGFEALTLNASGSVDGQLEPFRIFTATESALKQDLPATVEGTPPDTSPQSIPVRFLHYLVGSDLPTLLSEHLYLAEPAASDAMNGLCELLTLDQGGHFLSLERSFGPFSGFGAQLFQIATGGATDISSRGGLQGNWTGITPIYKRSLLNLADLNLPLDNLEAMTLGPRLPDGSRSLILMSDDNFQDAQVTQFLLFRLRGIS